MSPEMLSTLARVKSLALAAMIEAGGKPCWVAAYAPEGSPAAGTIASPRVRRPSLAPQYRPRRSPPAAAAAESIDDVVAASSPPIGGDVAGTLTALERAKLQGCSPKLLASIERALLSAERGPAPGSVLAQAEAARVQVDRASVRKGRE